LAGIGGLAFELLVVVLLIPRLPFIRQLRWLFCGCMVGFFLMINATLGIKFWIQCVHVLLLVDIPAAVVRLWGSVASPPDAASVPTVVQQSSKVLLGGSHAPGVIGLLMMSAMVIVMYFQAEAWPLSNIPMYAFEVHGLDSQCRFSSSQAFFKHVDFCATQLRHQLCVPWCAVEVQKRTSQPNLTAATVARAQPLKRTELSWASGDEGNVLLVHFFTQLLTKTRDSAILQGWSTPSTTQHGASNAASATEIPLELDPKRGPVHEYMQALAKWLRGSRAFCDATGSGAVTLELLPRLSPSSGVVPPVLASATAVCP